MSCVDKLSGGESKQPGWKPEAAKDADLLGVTIGCSPEEVSSAYRQAPLWAHPDKGGRLQSLPIKNTATKIAANERIQCQDRGPEGYSFWGMTLTILSGHFREKDTGNNVPDELGWVSLAILATCSGGTVLYKAIFLGVPLHTAS